MKGNTASNEAPKSLSFGSQEEAYLAEMIPWEKVLSSEIFNILLSFIKNATIDSNRIPAKATNNGKWLRMGCGIGYFRNNNVSARFCDFNGLSLMFGFLSSAPWTQ
jgi:hypothetical protein